MSSAFSGQQLLGMHAISLLPAPIRKRLLLTSPCATQLPSGGVGEGGKEEERLLSIYLISSN